MAEYQVECSKADRLAINGGEPVRRDPMPARIALGEQEERMVIEAMHYFRERGQDPGYNDEFEQRYCRDIATFMGGGYADAVATGTASIFVALQALELPAGSDVIVSPITETGSISPIIMAGLKPKLADSKPRHYNIDAQHVFDRVDENTSAIMVVHAAGQPVSDIAEIVREAHVRGIRVIEDCSQSIGSTVDGTVVGCFGDIAAWSTGSRKNQISGGCGGVVFTKDRDLMGRALIHADRGKPLFSDAFEERNPGTYTVPALNLNADELSCAIGIASLQRLPETMARRLAFVKGLDQAIMQRAGICEAYGWTDGDSPFFQPVIVDEKRTGISKIRFAESMIAEGINLNPDYKFLVADWLWLKPYMADDFETPNARWIRDNSFNVFLNENYTATEVEDVVSAIAKIEDAQS